MVESKSKKFKFGKLFGRLSSSLAHIHEEQLSIIKSNPETAAAVDSIELPKATAITPSASTTAVHKSIENTAHRSTNKQSNSGPFMEKPYISSPASASLSSSSASFQDLVRNSRPLSPPALLLNEEVLSTKLMTIHSVTPPNGGSPTTTSPILLSSVEQKLRNHSAMTQTNVQHVSNLNQLLHQPRSGTASSVSISNGYKLEKRSRPSPSVSRSASQKRSVTGSNVSLSSASPAPQKPRFYMLENGDHEHNLRSAKRQEKLSNMLKDLLGAKRLRDEAKSAVPDILQSTTPSATNTQQLKPPTLFAGLVNRVKNNPNYSNELIANGAHGPDYRSFVEKYGRCQEVIGRGAFGVVRVSHKKLDGPSNEETLFAVKEFKRKPNENEKKYNRRLTSEFCISSSLKHINIINTLDLLKDAKGDFCEVMEFCTGGDLYTLIIAQGKLEYAEADCFFKQLIKGVNYMHDMGVAHRDLKPENLLLTQNGILKITDFGNGECFKMAWETEIQYSEGICGSSPYIAPEEFTQELFDPRCVDVWACGVIYMAMRTGRQLWKLADPTKDEFFEEYLVKRKEATGYEPIESLKRARCRNVIYSILDPKPERRITSKQILNSEWGREIRVCAAGEGKSSTSGLASTIVE